MLPYHPLLMPGRHRPTREWSEKSSVPRVRTGAAGKAAAAPAAAVDPRVELRGLAVECSIQARQKAEERGDAKWAQDAATRLQHRVHQHVWSAALLHIMPKKLDSFCTWWYNHWDTHRSLADAPRSGRPPKLPDDVQKKAASLIIEKQPLTMRSMQDEPTVSGWMQEFSTTLRTIFRAARSKEPKLGKHVKREFRPELNTDKQVKRLEIASRWYHKAIDPAAAAALVAECERRVGELRQHPNPSDNVPSTSSVPEVQLPPVLPAQIRYPWLRRTIWLDAAHFYITPKGELHWGLKADSVTSENKCLNSRSPWCVHFYAAISYTWGPLAIILVSGTRGGGYKPAQLFKVGCTTGWCAHVAACPGLLLSAPAAPSPTMQAWGRRSAGAQHGSHAVLLQPPLPCRAPPAPRLSCCGSAQRSAALRPPPPAPHARITMHQTVRA